MVVTPKLDLSAGECFVHFLTTSMERAGNPYEPFTWAAIKTTGTTATVFG